jgi:uncharacterized cupredoxin-like copper-binding protein
VAVLALGAVALAMTVVPGVSGAASRTTNRPANSALVTERDFHITAPTKVRAGDVVLHVHNLGPDDHELLVVRAGKGELPLRSDGLTVDEDKIEPRTIDTLEAGEPGARRTLRVHLKPGRYELFCNMYGHYLSGMETDIEVPR